MPNLAASSMQHTMPPDKAAVIVTGANEKGLAGSQQRNTSLPNADQAIPQDRLVSYWVDQSNEAASRKVHAVAQPCYGTHYCCADNNPGSLSAYCRSHQ